MNIDDIERFAYQPRCYEKDCKSPAAYKVAAPWSDGTSRELKNYGMACEAHARSLLERARARRDAMRTAEGESVGRVSLYPLGSGRREVDLEPIED